MKITNEEWCWESIHLEPQILKEFPVATKGDTIVLLVSGFKTIYLKLYSKNLAYSYEYGRNTRDCRTTWELECQKSRLINEGFKMNWENYQAILEMFNERFKTHSHYLG